MTFLWLTLALAAGDERIDPATLTGFDAPAHTTEATDAWWTQLGDPMLAEAVDAAMGGNQQLSVSYGRLEQARAGAMSTFAPLLPRASFDVTATGQPLENVAFCVVGQPDFANPPAGDWCWQGSARLNASWQLDIFGRQSASWLASTYDVEASKGDLGAQQLSIASSVSAAYLDAVATRRQLAIIQAQLDNQRDLLEIVELRYEQGSSSSLDVLQQRSSTSATEALLPPARLNAQAARQRLAILLGNDPAANIAFAEALPELGAPPRPGSPEQLVSARPDLRAAESRWQAGRTRVTSSTLGLLPSLTATAAAGWSYALTDDLSTLDVWSVGGTLSVPIFNGGSTYAQIRSARAQRDQATSTFNQALLDAVSDVRNAMSRDVENQTRREAVDNQLAAARLAYQESRERYLAGIDSFITVLTAWNSLQQSELNSLQAHRDVLTARIALFVALGGGASGVSP